MTSPTESRFIRCRLASLSLERRGCFKGLVSYKPSAAQQLAEADPVGWAFEDA